MKNLLIFLVMVLLFGSCVTQKKCNYKYPCTSGKDSIYIETIDTFKVAIRGDTIRIETDVPCKDFELTTENNRLKQTIKVINGKLQQTLSLKPDTVTLYSTKIVEKIKEVTVPIKTNHVPLFWKITGWLGIVSFIYIVLKIALKMRLI